jgi:hypothetical protein
MTWLFQNDHKLDEEVHLEIVEEYSSEVNGDFVIFLFTYVNIISIFINFETAIVVVFLCNLIVVVVGVVVFLSYLILVVVVIVVVECIK